MNLVPGECTHAWRLTQSHQQLTVWPGPRSSAAHAREAAHSPATSGCLTLRRACHLHAIRRVAVAVAVVALLRALVHRLVLDRLGVAVAPPHGAVTPLVVVV